MRVANGGEITKRINSREVADTERQTYNEILDKIDSIIMANIKYAANGRNGLSHSFVCIKFLSIFKSIT